MYFEVSGNKYCSSVSMAGGEKARVELNRHCLCGAKAGEDVIVVSLNLIDFIILNK
jgi:hypothetical protein